MKNPASTCKRLILNRKTTIRSSKGENLKKGQYYPQSDCLSANLSLAEK